MKIVTLSLAFTFLGFLIAPGYAQTTYEECKETVRHLDEESAEETKKQNDCFNNTYGGSKMNCPGLNLTERNNEVKPSERREKSLMDQANVMRQACSRLLAERDRSRKEVRERNKKSEIFNKPMAEKYDNIHSGVKNIQDKSQEKQPDVVNKIQNQSMQDIRKSHQNTLGEVKKLGEDIDSLGKEDNAIKKKKKTIVIEEPKSF